MTYNIRHGVGMDRVLDLQRTASVIRSAAPDIVILNEVDDGTVRAFGVHQADSLGKLLGLQARFGRSIDYDGGLYGHALLSNYPILDFQIVDLSVDSLLEGRSVFISKIDLEGDTITIMGTHLGLSPAERQEQVRRIISARSASKGVILAGDFNFEPDSQNYLELAKYFRDGRRQLDVNPALTFPADKPVRRIDYFFVGDDIELIKSADFDNPDKTTASDHLPQLLHFKWSAPRGEPVVPAP